MYSEAIAAAQKALGLAEATNQQQLADQIRNYLELFRRGQPYHEIPSEQDNSSPESGEAGAAYLRKRLAGDWRPFFPAG